MAGPIHLAQRNGTGEHPVVSTPLDLAPQDAAPAITPAAYQAALNTLPPWIKPWALIAFVLFGGGGALNLAALWNAPKQITETREEVAELREVVCLLAEKEGISAEACRRRYGR